MVGKCCPWSTSRLETQAAVTVGYTALTNETVYLQCLWYCYCWAPILFLWHLDVTALPKWNPRLQVNSSHSLESGCLRCLVRRWSYICLAEFPINMVSMWQKTNPIVMRGSPLSGCFSAQFSSLRKIPWKHICQQAAKHMVIYFKGNLISLR